MSRIAKWKLEKTKVKVVFRLQFHATHIPQSGWDKLFVSFIPADSGKATAKTGKSNVRNGTCKWADPIYETTRLLQDAKTKQYDEKLYKLVVAMGSSRSSLLGEANINLADFADASKPSVVALVLHGCTYGTVLHVTVQLLTAKTGFREFEQQRELRERGLETTNNRGIHDESDEKLSTSTEMTMDKINKGNSKVRFKSETRELPSLVEEVELNEDYAESAVGIDDSSNTSESLYTERNDSNTNEIDIQKSTASGDLGGILPNQCPHRENPEKGDPPDRLLAHGSNDWVHGWSSDYSVDNDLASAYEENNRLRVGLELAESSMLELKLEISSLQTHADELSAETEKFSYLLAKEIGSGEELGKEVSVLKSELLKFKDDFEQLKHSRFSPCSTGRETIPVNQVHLSQDLQMRLLQCLLVVEDKVNEVQSKALLKPDDMDFSFLQPDLEVLQLVLQDLKQKTTEVTSLLNVVPVEQDVKQIGVMLVQEPEQIVSRDKLGNIDAGQFHYGGNFHCLNGQCEVSQEHVPVDAVLALEGKISELERELEESKTERESLTRKMDQMECYYEALIQELEENQKQMLGELQNLRNEHSTCLYTITSCNAQMEKMHGDMNEQLLRFSEDRRVLESHNKELEIRAINSETTLKRARWNYSIAVDKLQKDLELLSFQVLSMFETNENLIRQAFTESSHSCFLERLGDNSETVDSCLHTNSVSFLPKKHKVKVQGHQAETDLSLTIERLVASDDVVSLVIEGKKNMEVPTDTVIEARRDLDALDSSVFPVVGMVLNSNYGSLESDTVEFQRLHNENAELKKQLLHEKIPLEKLKRSLHLQEQRYETVESELGEMHLISITLDVFAKGLQGAFYDACNDIKLMEEKMVGLTQQLAHSTESNELLILRLHTALEDVNILKAYRENCSTKCDELSLQNQILQEKNQRMFDENGSLNKKITEYERMMREYRNYETRYKDCNAEKTELVNLLNQETLEKCSLHSEVSTLHEEITTLKEDLNHESLVKRNLEETVSSLQDKLRNLRSTMICYYEQINEPFLPGKPLKQELEDTDFTSIILEVKELQKEACDKILQLICEKKDVEEQKDTAQRSLSAIKSEIPLLKQKYEIDMHNMVNKLDAMNTVVNKLQLEIENVGHKLKSSLEAEDRYAEQLMEIFSKLAVSESELQQVSAENKDLAQNILTLGKINEELERIKLTVVDSSQEHQALTTCLQAGNEKAANLASELSRLKETLNCLSDELLSERSLRAKLEGQLIVLTSEVYTKNDQLISCEMEKAEVLLLKQQLSDLEVEKSRLCHLLLQSEECQKKADKNASFFRLQSTDLETQLAASHEHLLASDIELICMRNQFQTRIKELLQQLESLDRCYRELHLKHLDVLGTLNGRISTEARYVEDNARSLSVLNSVRSELQATIAERSALVDRNNVLLAEVENFKAKEAVAAVSCIQENHQYDLEIERLQLMLLSSEEAIDNLTSSRDELEITVTVLKAKFEEQNTLVMLLEEYGNEIMMLQTQRNELCQRLSDQILKTEEFKNVSVHLKELKDKADCECLQAREKTEAAASVNSMQETLRMAFIREQCETRVQELQSQLYVCKKHGEEMLLRLQDSLNEVENRKKIEASYIKRNEELSVKILELENELQIVLAEKRACDEMKAELECSLISLDCCKEEKHKLEISLQECNEERAKISVELGSLKERFRSLEFRDNFLDEKVLLGCLSPKPVRKETSCEEQDACHRSIQDGQTSESLLGSQRQVVMNQDDLRQLTLINDHFEVKSLRSSMDHLHEQLEMMKNENMASIPQDAKHFEPDYHGLQRQLLQLHKANGQLGSIYPLFNEFSSSGNALERVLALEIELAEALQGKKKSNVHFQSSFLKQHADEEAVFQSFRDINELIKDMLELKGRYKAVDAELKEMHDRYSQLSVEFAEVEGERQKLVMTLKHARVPKKMLHLCNSMPASLEDDNP